MSASQARPLGQVALVALGINGVVGVGIFFVPASVSAQLPGSAGALVYACTALLCFPIALAFSRLGPRFDEDGGPYLYARAAFGPAVGFVMGWLTYVSAVFSTSAVIRGLAEAVTSTGPGTPLESPSVVATATVLALALVTALGLRVAAWAWTAITFAKLLPLCMLVGAWLLVGPTQGAVDAAPVTRADPGHWLRAGLLVLFALQGFEVVPVPAKHVKQPQAIARATPAVLLFAGVLYVLLHMACLSALPQLAASSSPLVDAARVYGGSWLATVLVVGTSVSAVGIALGMMAMSPRYLAALGRQDALGKWVGRDSVRGVPMRALLVTSLCALTLVQFGRLDQLFALSSVAVLTQYGSTAAALIWLAWRRRLGLGWVDVVIGLGAMVAVLVVMTGATCSEIGRAAVVLAAGVVVKLAVHLAGRRGQRRPG
ncbi:MAG: APC family permease [Polyangiaceae bacterium]|jgi:amino acid transporter|nr:APC family permease [Polyangiaceae bacterium]